MRIDILEHKYLVLEKFLFQHVIILKKVITLHSSTADFLQTFSTLLLGDELISVLMQCAFTVYGSCNTKCT